MNILVTGGAGYIGCELIYKLSQEKDVEKIIIYDNLSRGNFNLFISNRNKISGNKVQFISGDLLDSRKLKKYLKDIDTVFHLAAKVDTPFSNLDSHIFEQVNHWGTAELIYALEEIGRASKFIFLSSASVYGSSKILVDESTVPNPKTFYSVSKLRGEDHVKRLFGKMETIILRAGNVYGYTPAIRFDSVINKFMFEANFNNRISIHGSGKQSRSFINVGSVVDALIKVKNSTIPSGLYNLIGKNYEILDLVDIMKEIYTDLEFIFINQHLELRELKVNPETKLDKYFSIEHSDLKEDLINFRQKFSFQAENELPSQL